MYEAQENPRDKYKKPVYWLVGLIFICCLINWGKVPGLWHDHWEQVERNATFEAQEVDKAWQAYDDVLLKLKSKEGYGPIDFFQDRYVLVPLRERFARAMCFTGESSYPERNILSLSKMAEGLLDVLYKKAEDNFPRFSPNVSRAEGLRNQEKWREAEFEAPIPFGCEPIHISGWGVLMFCKWVAVSYLKFLPFSFFLILFQLWRRRQSFWQEIALRPGFFLIKVLEGLVGVVIYSDLEPAVEWEFAKLSAAHMRASGVWHLSKPEEEFLWLEAYKKAEITPEIVIHRSKMAITVGYLIVVFSAPFLALSSFTLQKPTEQAQVSPYQEQQQKSSQWFMFASAIFPEMVKLQTYFEPVAQVKIIFLLCIVAEKGWFLPPILAPLLRRR